jgi:hypothetical protein
MSVILCTGMFAETFEDVGKLADEVDDLQLVMIILSGVWACLVYEMFCR